MWKVFLLNDNKLKVGEGIEGWYNFCYINIERFDNKWFINILFFDLLIINCMIWELYIYF